MRAETPCFRKEKLPLFPAFLRWNLLLIQAQQIIERGILPCLQKQYGHMSEIPPFPKPHLIRKGPSMVTISQQINPAAATEERGSFHFTCRLRTGHKSTDESVRF